MARSYKKTIIDKISFDSETEALFYLRLKQAKKAGKIKEFIISPKYELQEYFINTRGVKESSIDHYPDYLITLNDDTNIIVDTKGGGGIVHENDAKLKRKMWQYQNRGIPYYYVSLTPKYLGSFWVESTPYFDFFKKLQTKYKKVYPEVKKYQRNRPQFLPKEWKEYFIFHNIAGVFYTWEKTYTKAELAKMKKEEERKS